MINPDIKLDGWCISFIGYSKRILIGWYKNNVVEGNWMIVNGKDMSILEAGWYKDGRRVGSMKEDSVYKNFGLYDIFLDPYNIAQYYDIIDSEFPKQVKC